jgi:uncharacterized protein (DUF2336 family)
MSARERLTRLIDLAPGGAPEERRQLAMELAEVLLDWPADYPAHMRTSFALLLEKIVVQLDGRARRELARRFAPDPAAPLALLNELYFDSGRELRETILKRNAQASMVEAFEPSPIDEPSLIRAARDYPPETFAQTFARLLGIPLATAGRAIADVSGEGLVILCKGAHLSRATFSTIAMLTDASLDSAQRKLELFETVPEEISARMVQFWRAQRGTRQAIAA